MPDSFVTWDPTLLSNPTGPIGYNRGCPPGYFAELVPAGSDFGQAIDPANPGGNWVRCKFYGGYNAGDVAATQSEARGRAIGDTVGDITGAVSDTLGTSGRAGAQTVKDGLTQVGTSFKSAWDALGLPNMTLTLAVGGVAAGAFIVWKVWR